MFTPSLNTYTGSIVVNRIDTWSKPPLATQSWVDTITKSRVVAAAGVATSSLIEAAVSALQAFVISAVWAVKRTLDLVRLHGISNLFPSVTWNEVGIVAYKTAALLLYAPLGTAVALISMRGSVSLYEGLRLQRSGSSSQPIHLGPFAERIKTWVHETASDVWSDIKGLSEDHPYVKWVALAVVIGGMMQWVLSPRAVVPEPVLEKPKVPHVEFSHFSANGKGFFYRLRHDFDYSGGIQTGLMVLAGLALAGLSVRKPSK